MGIADGIIKSKDFIGKSDFVLMLGDNFFYGQSLSDQIKKFMKKKIASLQYKIKNLKIME